MSFINRVDFNINNFNSLLKRPVLNKPMTDAIHLHPCGHKISRAALESIQQMQRGSDLCPVCKTQIIDTFRDLSVLK